ncbi:phosphopyruvate hydratase [Kitasatospora sp. NA04385]|uniref:phosphopyruvate hydratase n=1 Tax=Kitasatospora sp. NA04385 TaxID=2742135 RepID=UPI001590CA33|nr:phosphopyruvate hydratase [Kitasatospora sp. NA04385]QKW17834.1 phosphopyruvate hydratase [Kitasatospora sp. NA04385]
MAIHLAHVHAAEILDSRSRPTLEVVVGLGDGSRGRAGVPSGASTGATEAVELRDGDPARYRGQGVLKAVAGVNGEIADALRGATFPDQEALDAALRELDGTPDKSRLGANALIGVSMAAARADAVRAGVPLWQHLTPGHVEPRLPVPHFNVLNGGVHAPNPLDFQEFMIAPLGAPSTAEAVRAGSEVYGALRARLAAAGHATGLGDEGGFAPGLHRPEEALSLIVAAIGDAGYRAGRDGVAIALDPAASEFRRPDGSYLVDGQARSSTDMISWYRQLADDFPIWSIEDGLGQDDSDGWAELTGELGDRVQLVGDDNLTTNPALIAAAVEAGVANAVLIKPNQIGTVSETLHAMRLCRQAGYAAMVSHRSGETDDTFIADLAVGTGCGQIKSGAPARGERTAKYNRLLQIADTHPALPHGLR